MDIKMQIEQLEKAYCNALNSFVSLYDSQNGCEMNSLKMYGGKHEDFVYDIETY